jgi:urocanate hydratase
MEGVLFVTSGLGGMSGAQPKAGNICGCITVIAEVHPAALEKRLKQGWLNEKYSQLPQLINRIKEAKSKKEAISLGYLGNVVELWEALAESDVSVELGSDQTSLHDPFGGGYYPIGLSLEDSNLLIRKDPELFKSHVYSSLKRQVQAINKLTAKGMIFWDYGNSFLLEASRADAEVWADKEKSKFRYPSYFESIMDDIFALGFGPFRWVCTSCEEADLLKTDELACQVLERLLKDCPEELRQCYQDNLEWIRNAHENKLVIGSQARILYADVEARAKIAQEFNKAIKSGAISKPIVLSRDHHDVSGTDSPFRETSNIKDGK